MMRSIRHIIALGLFCTSFAVVAQNKQELQKQREKLVEEISYANSLLEQTKKDKKLSLNQLQLLRKKIEVREELIRHMGNEIRSLDRAIEKEGELLVSLDLRLEKLREQYADMIRKAYEQKHSYNRVMFLISSEDLHQAYRRLRYLKEYSDYRKIQAEEIKLAIEEKERRLSLLKKHKGQKNNLLDEKRKEKKLLAYEKNKHQLDVQELKAQEDQLLKSIREKQQKSKELQMAIQRVIEEELRRAREEAKKKGKPVKDFALTPEAKALSASFTGNKGKLPWPVSSGEVITKFGKHRHPVLPNITIDNIGIEIATTSGSTARASFKGVVSSVLKLPTGLNVVIIRHGEYSTIYSNLTEVYVAKGDKVDTKQLLGLIFTDPDDQKCVLEYQLWKNTNPLNPQQWLFKK